MRLPRLRASALLFITMVVAALVGLSCLPKGEKAGSPQATPSGASAETAASAIPAAPPETVTTTANVIMVSGEVGYRAESGDWKTPDIGETIPAHASIRTGKTGACDLQFGRLGAARIGPGTTIELRNISLAASRSSVEVSLMVGSLASKVTKLASKDSYAVRCSDSICGVRGTEFLVRAQAGKPSLVAVKEGRVALLPPSFDPAALQKLATTPAGEALVDAVIEAMLAVAPSVGAGEETRVSPASIAAEEKALVVVTENLGASLAEQAAAAVEPAPPAGFAAQAVPDAAAETMLSDKLRNAFDGWKTALEATPQKTTLISAESSSSLKDLPKPSVEATPPSAPSPAPHAELPAAPAGPSVPTAPVVATPLKPEDALSILSLPCATITGGIVDSESGLFAADSLGAVVALGPEGKALWSTKTENGANSSSEPVALGSRVYYAGDAKLVALDAATGKRLFSVDLGPANSGFFGRRPYVTGGKLYLSSDTGLEVLDAQSGARLGTISFPDGSGMTPAALGPGGLANSIGISTSGGGFLIVDLAASMVTATIPTKATQPLASAPLVQSGVAIFADRKGLVSCVELMGQRLRWERSLEPGKSTGVYQDPVAWGKAVYLFSKSTIYALSTEDGSPLFPPLRSVAAAPCIVDGKLWYATAAGSIIEADAATGGTIASIKSPAAIVGRAAAQTDAAGRAARILFPTATGLAVLDLATLEKAHK